VDFSRRVFQQLLESSAEAATGAEGANFDDGLAPSGAFSDFGDGAFLKVEQGDDDPVLWGEGFEERSEEFAAFSGGGVVCGVLEEGFSGVSRVVWEIAPPVLRAPGFGAERVQADVDAKAGDPVFERARGFVPVKIFEELHEYFLNQVFGCGASREMVCNDPMNLGMERVNESARGRFVPRVCPCGEVVLKRGLHADRWLWSEYTGYPRW
jgi:hypothetical protein